MKKCENCIIGEIIDSGAIYHVSEGEDEFINRMGKWDFFKFCPDCGNKNKEVEEYLR